MDSAWEKEFCQRMSKLNNGHTKDKKAISIKVRVSSGCFHREHSPRAYEIIDSYLRLQSPVGLQFKEHESGPELLVLMALGTAGITFAKSVIDLVTAIIKARSEGIRKGDSPNYPIELIVRDVGPDGKVREERVLRFAPDNPVNSKLIEESLKDATGKLILPSSIIPVTRPNSKKKKTK